MKIFKIILSFVFLFSVCHSYIHAETKNTENNGISIYPAKINVFETFYNYDLKIKNNYPYIQKFNLKTDILDNIDITLAKKQSIAPFIYFDENSFTLEPNEQKVITIHLNKDIDNIQTSLYGRVLIITNNSTQTTINQGFAIPVIRNLPSVLGATAPLIEIKDVKFNKDLLNFTNQANISFSVSNKGDSIQKLYGEYSITNSNGETIFHKAISDYDYTLNPNDQKDFTDKIDLQGVYDKYTLTINISDGQGNNITKATTELIYINTQIFSIISITLVLVIFLFIKFKNKIFKFRRRVVFKTLNSIVLIIIIGSAFSLNIHAQSLQSTTYRIPESDFTSGTESTSTTYRIRDEQGNNSGGTASSTSYGTVNGTNPLYFSYVPQAPTVSNNSGSYYDRLNIVLNVTSMPTDYSYAIFVTSTSYAGVKYVKSDNTLTSTLDNDTGWRNYSSGSPNWGSTTGTIVTGLTYGTPYTFYVKARQRYTTTCSTISCNLPASESPVVLLPSASATPNTTTSTGSPTLSFQLIGVSIGGINDTASTSTSVNYGILSSGTPRTASNTLRVATNAFNGFNVSMSANQKLQSGSSFIDWFTGSSATYAAPQTWSSPTSSYPNAGWIGYYTQDTDITQFSGSKYAPFPVGPSSDIVDKSTVQVSGNDDSLVTYKIEINASQPAGNYTGMTITYLLTGSF